MPKRDYVPIGRVAMLARYPVKSMAGEQVVWSRLEPGSGMPGDRDWVVRDEEQGGFLTGKKLTGLMQLSATTRPPDQGGTAAAVRLTFADGRQVDSDSPWVHAALTAALGRRVTLQPRRAAVERDFYRLARPMQGAEMRYLLGLRDDEPLPDLSPYPLGMLLSVTRYATPPGMLVDAGPLHCVTTASLDALAASDAACDPDPRRFRPNILLRTLPDLTGFIEAEWTGCTLKIGTAVLRITVPTLRCAMPGHAQPGLEQDAALLRAIKHEAAQKVGVYCEVMRGGVISVGDPVFLKPLPSAGPVRTMVSQIVSRGKARLIDRVTASAPRQPPPAADPPGYRAFRITAQRRESSDVVSLILEAEQPEPTPAPALPGQHVVIAIPAGPDGRTVYRAYSLSGNPQARSIRISVRRQGAGSTWLHGPDVVGKQVMVLGPRGPMALFPDDVEPIVLAATGIGITPFMAFLHAVAAHNPQRAIHLLVGARDPQDFPFDEELALLRNCLPRLHITFSFSMEGRRLCDDDVVSAVRGMPGAAIALCGHEDFMERTRRALLEAGIPDQRIILEHFSAPGGRHETAGGVVEFRRSGQRIAWTDYCGSILELAERSGVNLASGCRYGACQTCAVTLIEGKVTYPAGTDPALNRSVILACCALPDGDIVLDL